MTDFDWGLVVGFIVGVILGVIATAVFIIGFML